MPLRDHFRPPVAKLTSWEGFHGSWPTVLVMALNRKLPPRYVAEPRVRLGDYFEIDVGSCEKDEAIPFASEPNTGEGGVATATWAPPPPTFDVAAELPDQDEYEVLVYDTDFHRRLVAAIEIVSPANKDRPDNRRTFVAKCAALLQHRVSVALIDLVTTCHFNLYSELLDLIGQTDPTLASEPPTVSAAACRFAYRWTPKREVCHFQAWNPTLALGQPLPTLPLWLTDDLAIPLELEPSYEETCRILRIP